MCGPTSKAVSSRVLVGGKSFITKERLGDDLLSSHWKSTSIVPGPDQRFSCFERCTNRMKLVLTGTLSERKDIAVANLRHIGECRTQAKIQHRALSERIALETGDSCCRQDCTRRGTLKNILALGVAFRLCETPVSAAEPDVPLKKHISR